MSATKTPDTQGVRFSESVTSTLNSTADNSYKSPWPMRRHTPFAKTPQSRRIKVGQKSGRLTRTPPNESQISDWKQLINKTWHTYCVTPMYQFSYETDQMKKYSQHLSAQLKSEANKGTGVSCDESFADRAVFRVLKGLAIGADDSEAVDITVTSKKAGISKTIFSAMLISVEAQVGDQMQIANHNFTNLPLLLVKGPVAISRTVVDFLQTGFDCVINPLQFCPMELAWMVTVWTGFTEDGSKKPTELFYKVPDEVKGLQRITLTIEADDAKALWDSVHEEGSNEVTGEEVAAFIKSLERHFYRHFKVHLDAMTITRIGTGVAYVGQEGRLKILSENQVIQVLAYLTDLALTNTIV
ncbi:centromere protein L-like [Antedon mediterranea]|uniref:centromere protein L-like n=1 Tax=Antedon mediterranea TaxID=105859 RepID=UPI003AF57403